MTESGWVGLVVAAGTLSGALMAVGVVLVRALRGVRRAVHTVDLVQRALDAIEGAPASGDQPERLGLIELVGQVAADQRRTLAGQQVMATDVGALRIHLERLETDLREHIRDGHAPPTVDANSRPRRMR